MQPAARHEIPNRVVEAFVARFGIPALDLRALVLSALAVSPFLAWAIADSVADDVHFAVPVATIAIQTSEFVIDWLTWIFGVVVVAVGGALFAQRKSERLRPFQLTLTSLAIVGLMLLIESTSFGLRAYFVESRTLFEVGRHVVRQTSLLAAVAVASRLYVFWRSPSLDRRDARRFIVLAVLALGVAISSIVRWTIWVSTPPMAGLVPLPFVVLSGIVIFTSDIVINAGAVFMFGSAAIALLRRSQVETNLVWVTAASVAAMMVYAIIRFGSEILAPLLTDRNALYWIAWPQVVPGLVAGIVGGPFYLFVIDPEAMQMSLTKLPSLVRHLRNWPHQPSEGE